MTTNALLLNADYMPIQIISWQRAITLIIDEKADQIEQYVDKCISSANDIWEWPAVVRLRDYVQLNRSPKFNRSNVLARDGYECQYCGKLPRRNGAIWLEELTLDHVIPRAQSARNRVILPWNGKKVHVTCWENIVTACRDCNWAKRDRTPAEAGVQFKRTPRKPNAVDLLRMNLTRVAIPDEWKDYLPRDSAWRGYWEDELD